MPGARFTRREERSRVSRLKKFKLKVIRELLTLAAKNNRDRRLSNRKLRQYSFFLFSFNIITPERFFSCYKTASRDKVNFF